MAKDINKNQLADVIDATDINIPVSNNIIMGIGKQTLLGKKVFLLSLGKVTDRKRSDYKNIPRYKEYLDMGFDLTTGMVAEINMSDLKPAFGKYRSGQNYEQLKKLFNPNPANAELEYTLQGMFNMLIKNDISGIYGRTSLIQTTLYDKKLGKLFVKFTEEPIVRKNVIELKNNFTQLPERTMLNLFNFYAYSMYQMLKADFDKENSMRKKRGLPLAKTLKFRYELAELKFKLGILSSNKPEVSNALEVKNPHYTEIEEIYTTYSAGAMPRYNDFKKYVLIPAQKEIEEKTDMSYDFEPVKNGKKIVAVDILVTITNKETEIVTSDELTEDDKLDIEQEILELIEEKVTLKDIKAIAIAADYNVQKVKDAYEIMKDSSSTVDNVVGFLIKAIQNNYKKVSVHNTPRKPKNSFCDFEQRELDFDEIEKKLLSK